MPISATLRARCCSSEWMATWTCSDVEGEIKANAQGNARLRLDHLTGDRLSDPGGWQHLLLPSGGRQPENQPVQRWRGDQSPPARRIQDLQTGPHELVLGDGSADLRCNRRWLDLSVCRSAPVGLQAKKSRVGSVGIPEDFSQQIAQQVEDTNPVPNGGNDPPPERANVHLREQVGPGRVGRGEKPSASSSRPCAPASEKPTRAQEKIRRAQEKLERKLEAQRQRPNSAPRRWTAAPGERQSWKFEWPAPPTPPAPPKPPAARSTDASGHRGRAADDFAHAGTEENHPGRSRPPALGPGRHRLRM